MHTFILVSLATFQVWSLPSSSTAFMKEEHYELRMKAAAPDSGILTGLPLSSHISTWHTQGRSRDCISINSPLNGQEHSENKTTI